ncbi:hypothetical protein Btru_034481 [Bulinus truncatus]|nr:hypothetical protein Btru_034481 [Bulinus truncatus]
MTDLCNSEKNVVSENKERAKVQDENIPCQLINVESNTPTPEQKTDLTPQLSQPWSDTVIFLHRWKNSTSSRNCSSGLEESSGNNYLGKHSSDLLQNLEILSKLTVTADGKIKSMKTEDNTVLRKISDNPKNSMNSFHNFKFPQKTSATKLNVETNADQDVSIQLPKLTWT